MRLRKPSLRGGSVLPVIAGLFLASGLVRFGDGTAQALTEELRDMSAKAHETTVAEVEKCPPPPDIAEVLAALQDREAEIASREAVIEERFATLEIAEKEIARQMAALESAEASLRSTITLADDAAETDVARLTAVYESMKAEEAAALFSEMDPDFAAGFLGRMQPQAAAAVMAGLEPSVAYTISVILAGRNARAPKD